MARDDRRQFLMSVYHDGDLHLPDGVTIDQVFAAVGALNEELNAQGALVYANGLMPPATATWFDASGQVHDGPRLTDNDVAFYGFWIIEVADEAEALDWARRASATHCAPTVEVRPLQPLQ